MNEPGILGTNVPISTGTTYEYEIRDVDVVRSFDVGIYLSADEEFDPGDLLIHEETIVGLGYAEPSLDADGNFATEIGVHRIQTGSILTPDADRPYVIAVADTQDAITESDETNNSAFFLSVVRPDIIARFLSWNVTTGGVEFSYAIAEADIAGNTTAGLFWARGETLDDRFGKAVYDVPFEHAVGTHGTYYVPTSVLGTPPIGATHLLLVVDPPTAANPGGTIDEVSEENNVRSFIFQQPCIVFRDMDSWLIPGIDHVGFFPGGFSRVWESQLRFSAGDYYDSILHITVPISGGISGVCNQHTLGSFLHNSVDPRKTLVNGPIPDRVPIGRVRCPHFLF